MKKLKIAYITVYDAMDINNWSGSGYHIAKTVEKYLGDVTYIGNLKIKRFIRHWFKKLWHKLIFRKSYDINRSALTGVAYAQLVEKELGKKNFDLIFCPDTIPIAYLKTNVPIVFWNDANFHGMIDYQYFNYSNESIKEGDNMNKLALENASLAIYASDWAGKGAVEYYNVSPEKVKVIPFGANMTCVPSVNELKLKLNEVVNLLFVGKDWENKGGKVAYNAMINLNERGIKCTLTVVGCVPPASFSDDRLKIIPFLDKSKDDDVKLLRELYLAADFFILPTRKECYGVVFCESAAFGLPVLSTITGGITTIVQEGVNGFLFPLASNGISYADKVIEIINGGCYNQLCISSRQRYDQVLNWDAAGERLKKEISTIFSD